MDAWLCGDAGPLLSWMAALGTRPLWALDRLRWELSTTLGFVVEAPHVFQGDRPIAQSLAFSAPRITGGAPQRVLRGDETAQAWTHHARQRLNRTRHRASMGETLHALLAAEHPFPDDAFALLRHHTDAPVDFFAGRVLVGPSFGTVTPAEVAAELQHLGPLFSDAGAFDAHLEAGLASGSLPRRDLSWRLLRLPR
ncbi:MAG: hypothetical protein AB8H86_31770 [Polyangiales bacterium]